ncbi:MAG TPA: alpha/beta fold hydrolase [Pseudolabrys sp.]|nr:alpha/beta fold hydrolase [Pseudolabrys sp.]
MVILKWSAIIALGVYLAVVLAMYVMQRAVMYPAPQAQRTAPTAVGFAQAQEIVLETADGEKAIAWHVPPRDGKPVVLFFHGNGEVLAWRVPRFSSIVEDGTGLIALSYRGYAGSSGTPSEAGLIADAEAVYGFAALRYAPQRIVPWGYSLGSGVAVAIAAAHPVGGLILEAPYTSTVDIAAAAFPYLPVRWLLRDRFHSDRRIGSVRAPLLIMHGVKDRVIPIRFGERLFALANEPKRMVRFPEADHVYSDDIGTLKAARDFLAGLPLEENGAVSR